MKKILIVDDEVNTALLLSKFLTRNGFEVTTASNGGSAMEHLKSGEYDLVLCDFRLEDTDGREMLKSIKSQYPKTGVIIITGYSDIKMAVELIKMGAYDYITKPLYPDEILNTINKAIETHHALVTEPQEELAAVSSPSSSKSSKEKQVMAGEFVVGKSKASKELLRQIELVAPTTYSVIILGESGTGKESVAKSIHLNSPRRDQPFIAMDCGSLTKELAQSEFFGHEKGSFTGALYTKIGHFEMANGGTLFLDEVGNLSYDIQAALLRTVQERKVKRIGSTKEIDLDVRIIVATNENLMDGIQRGKFREDLYHRFNEFTIYMPPLRDRGSDIMLMAEHFLRIANKELGRDVQFFSQDVEESFMNYRWTGNIRELKNVIRRATLLTEGDTVQAKALPLEISNYTKIAPMVEHSHNHHTTETSAAPVKEHHNRTDLKNAALEAEYDTILKVLREVNFNKTKAAEILNIDRKTLYNKMKAINIGK
ncbi:sigma-54-dependent transcriptional regulator [Mucilaginibacter jinjuensis]|uniref:Sigma-54 dependent transcriptional regulator n=1 Tax=Mucilaginibacter jinjuensis TaxID=1176721 RepID=A0ABY7T7Y3_9SPHI|nr:sigma-54 dependent transcriptional regulator [Mucilaginibacter jinjuensis]WCT12343.1 sigma-54 dependent transcriptional regulator [Mucilaginibacter jinjuensis]